MRVPVLALFLAAGACNRSEPIVPAPIPTEEQEPVDAGAGGATLRGRVVLEGPRPAPRMRPVTVSQDACGSEARLDRSLVVDSSGNVGFAVVTLTLATSGGAAPAPRRTIVDHARCDFYPYVTVLPIGSTVRIENSDAVLHGIRRWGSTEAQTLPPAGELTLSFDSEEKTRLVCDLHYWSSAWIVTTAAPFHDVTDASGKFAISGLAPGRYRLVAWHERFGEVEREVVIDDGRREETIAFPSLSPAP